MAQRACAATIGSGNAASFSSGARNFSRPLFPIATATFNLFLAVDNFTTDANGLPLHNVTIYAGLAWGYQYRTPEPASFLIWSSLIAAAFAGLRRWRKRAI